MNSEYYKAGVKASEEIQKAEKRAEKFSFTLDAMDKNILYSALEQELNRQYANYGKRILAQDDPNDYQGSPENSLKRIKRVKGLMERVANLNHLGEAKVEDA